MHVCPRVWYRIYNQQKGVQPLTVMFQCSGSLCCFSFLSERYSEDSGRTGWSAATWRLAAVCSEALKLFVPTRSLSPPTLISKPRLILIQDVVFGTPFHFGGLYLRELSHCGWVRSRKITASLTAEQNCPAFSLIRLKDGRRRRRRRFVMHFLEPKPWASWFFFPSPVNLRTMGMS